MSEPIGAIIGDGNLYERGWWVEIKGLAQIYPDIVKYNYTYYISMYISMPR